jgi:hypothetical protein
MRALTVAFHLVIGRYSSSWLSRWRRPVSYVAAGYWSVIAINGQRSIQACATPLTMLAAPGARVDRQTPGEPLISPQVAASIAPGLSSFVKMKRTSRWRAASIISVDSPPGWPTMNGVPACLNASTMTSTVVGMRPLLPYTTINSALHA